jgi:hypothetical protein
MEGDKVDFYGDPPRLWILGQEYPGTAFTRSIGDAIAETVGVTAEPEMLSLELTSNDKILVIASDGIFEFLTNRIVIDLCSQSDTPLKACEAVVKAAYEQWLVYENRTDDITVIVCFLKCKRPPVNGEKGTSDDLVVAVDRALQEKQANEEANEETAGEGEGSTERRERFVRGLSIVQKGNDSKPQALTEVLIEELDVTEVSFSQATLEEVEEVVSC